LLSICYTGGKIYVACRSLDRAQHAVDDIVKQTGVSRSQLPIMQLDLASFKSIRSFASSFRESQLAGLIFVSETDPILLLILWFFLFLFFFILFG